MLVTDEIAEVYFRLLGTNGFHVKAEDENLPLRACVVVRTSSMKISRRHLADYVKKLCKKACRTCVPLFFPFNQSNHWFVVLLLLLHVLQDYVSSFDQSNH